MSIENYHCYIRLAKGFENRGSLVCRFMSQFLILRELVTLQLAPRFGMPCDGGSSWSGEGNFCFAGIYQRKLRRQTRRQTGGDNTCPVSGAVIGLERPFDVVCAHLPAQSRTAFEDRCLVIPG
jgi:hypothetical protein